MQGVSAAKHELALKKHATKSAKRLKALSALGIEYSLPSKVWTSATENRHVSCASVTIMY